MSNFQHAGDWSSLHAKVQSTLDPLVRANYKNRFGAAVGYLTADPISTKLVQAGLTATLARSDPLKTHRGEIDDASSRNERHGSHAVHRPLCGGAFISPHTFAQRLYCLRNSTIFAATLARMPSAPIVSTNAESMGVSFHGRWVPVPCDWRVRALRAAHNLEVPDPDFAATEASRSREEACANGCVDEEEDDSRDAQFERRYAPQVSSERWLVHIAACICRGYCARARGKFAHHDKSKEAKRCGACNAPAPRGANLCRTSGLPAPPGDLGLNS
jgi:hypothetical protein